MSLNISLPAELENRVRDHVASGIGNWGQIPIKFPKSDFLMQASEIAARNSIQSADMAQLLYLPVIARQDWIAVLDKQDK